MIVDPNIHAVTDAISVDLSKAGELFSESSILSVVAHMLNTGALPQGLTAGVVGQSRDYALRISKSDGSAFYGDVRKIEFLVTQLTARAILGGYNIPTVQDFVQHLIPHAHAVNGLNGVDELLAQLVHMGPAVTHSLGVVPALPYDTLYIYSYDRQVSVSGTNDQKTIFNQMDLFNDYRDTGTYVFGLAHFAHQNASGFEGVLGFDYATLSALQNFVPPSTFARVVKLMESV